MRSAKALAFSALTFAPLTRPISERGTGVPFGLPSFVPRALAAANAALVRIDIALLSSSATSAKTPTVNRFACGWSTQTNSTPAASSPSRKSALRDNRSSREMTSLAL